MKFRLIAGTINDWPDDNEWRNYTLDSSTRGIWNRDLEMAVQPDFVDDIRSLAQFRNETFDEIRCHHVLEHLLGSDGALALAAFYRILKTDGVLDIEVPDLDAITHAYVAGDLDADGTRQWLLGEQLPNYEPGDSHRFLWTEPELDEALTAIGFHAGERIETGHALRFRAAKVKVKVALSVS